MTKKQAQAILDGHLGWMIQSGLPLIEEFYTKIISRGLRPKTIVDYIREPFIFAPGNVRVTLDSDIRIGVRCADFFNPSGVTIPAGDAPIILEVKWDEFLPDIIRDAVQARWLQSGSIFKICRLQDLWINPFFNSLKNCRKKTCADCAGYFHTILYRADGLFRQNTKE